MDFLWNIYKKKKKILGIEILGIVEIKLLFLQLKHHNRYLV